MWTIDLGEKKTRFELLKQSNQVMKNGMAIGIIMEAGHRIRTHFKDTIKSNRLHLECLRV